MWKDFGLGGGRLKRGTGGRGGRGRGQREMIMQDLGPWKGLGFI